MNTTNEPAGIDLDKPDTLAALLCCLYEGPEIQRAATMLIDQAMQIEELTLARRAPAPVGDERALFEATMPSIHPRDRNMPDHSYNSPYLHIAWEVWQLARAESPAPVVAHDAPEAPASAQPDRGAAHAQQEAAPAEVTKSQERDYNWLLGLAKSKGYQTVYGALYAAPTTVPDHSERGAANAGGLPVDLIHDFRDAINIAHHRADHAGDTTRMKRWKEVSRRLEAYVRTINAPTTIAAGQEAANAKDAARPIPDAECAQGSCARGKDGCRGRCCLAGHKLPIVADIDSAAMAAVGAAGQEAANAKDAALANRVRDLIADHVADNWPMVRYHLEEVERKLRAINADYLLGQDSAAGQEGGDK